MKRFVAVHPQDGIFVGAGMGFAFFSLKECAGQYSVAVFESAAEASRILIHDWNLPPVLRYVEVAIDDPAIGALPSQLRAAGLADYLGDLEANYLAVLPVQGPIQ